MTPFASRLRAIANELQDRSLAALLSGLAMDLGRFEVDAARMRTALDELAGDASDDARTVRGLRPVGEVIEPILGRVRR